MAPTAVTAQHQYRAVGRSRFVHRAGIRRAASSWRIRIVTEAFGGGTRILNDRGRWPPELTSAPADAAIDEDERELATRARSDPSAFCDLADRHLTTVYRYVYAWSSDRGLAEDMTTEVFSRALSDYRNHRDHGRPFSTWLLSIAVEVVREHSLT